MLADLVTNSGALPALELTMRFAAQRQQILAHNIANLTTPGFQAQDVSVHDFRQTLAKAIDDRRARAHAEGPLHWKPTRELDRDHQGHLVVTPRTPASGILQHDRNNRDLERTMQALAENVATFRVASELMRSRMQLIQSAIAERTS